MHIQQTIAIIGATGNMGSAIAKSISKGPYRLLLKGNDKVALDNLVNEIKNTNTTAEVEAAVCPTDACWEADIIIIAVPDFDEEERFGLMKEVATQKIVVTLSDNYDYIKKIHQKLPFSKLVNVDSSNAENLIIQGEDEEAVREIRTIFSAAAINELHK